MATYDLNRLSSQIISRNRYSLTPSLSGRTDVFEFDISNNRIIGLHLHNISSRDDADLRLFRDSNGNGILDSGDQLVAFSAQLGNQDDSVRFDASAGTYFAQVSRYALGSVGNVSYDLDLSATYSLDTLSGDVIRRDNYGLSSTDPTDVFALTLNSRGQINLNLHDISTRDDADLRLFADSNNNGIFDSDDRQVASSRNASNRNEVINYAAAAGTYFAQVSRYALGSSGSVSYDLDVSATAAPFALSGSVVSRNNYGLSTAEPADTFAITLDNSRSINLHLHDISAGDNANLRLFADSNGNGVFDSSDRRVASSSRLRNLNDTINYEATAGTYFAQVIRSTSSIGNVSYDLDLSSTYGLGVLSGGVLNTENYNLSAADPTDTFAFTLNNNRHINLNLHGISTGDNANLQLFADSNNNGVFDAGDRRVARSSNSGNRSDTINYAASAGTYFAQVSRAASSIGDVSYDLDVSATTRPLALSGTVIQQNRYGVSTVEPADTFAITLDNSRDINLHLHNISAGDNADLRLFKDSNNNGVFDNDDRRVASASRLRNLSDSINYTATAGTYFAQVVRAAGSIGNVLYDLDLSSNYDLGILSGEVLNTENYNLSSADPTDTFAFTLNNSRQINLNLHGISAGDNANLQLFADSNNNGVFDSNDRRVARSSNSGNRSDTINYAASAGTYFAQVARAAGSIGDVSYDLDVSATTRPLALSGTVIPQNRYGVSAVEPADTFAITLDNNRSINLHLHNISANDDADLRLFADSNNNGVFDDGDRLVSSSLNRSNRNDSIDYSASTGTYFAQVSRVGASSLGNVTYDLDLSSSYDVGQLNHTITGRVGTLTAADPRDVYEFNLAQHGQIVLNLHNISSGDDADLRLYEDTNSNGIFDGDDQQIASSLSINNHDDAITYAAQVGTYFAQVERFAAGSSGTVSYDLDLSIGGTPATYQAFDANQVFTLNSNRDADHIIYLDFDGHTTTNTPWNSIASRSSIETAAYDLDGNTTNFSTSERENIWRIWQRVAEDFSPFNVNVTTEAPSLDRLSRSGSSDSQWGIRAVIGGDGSWYRNPAGGIAFLDSFNDDGDVPAFVFQNPLASRASSEIMTAEAISHEVGHALGLEHDGNNLVEYYRGHGSGDTSWAPIMGFSDFRAVTQWSRGEYRHASNTEDDLAIITGSNGFGYRTDDHGDSLVSASALTVGGNQAQTYGIIETNTDVDWFSFSAATGNIDLAINTFERGANLDILARLYNSAGQLLQQSNPLGSLSASFDVDLAGGDYFLSVTGTGTGNPNTGYSDYGSLGQYSISGTIA